LCAFSFCTYTSRASCKFVFDKVSVNGLGFGKEKKVPLLVSSHLKQAKEAFNLGTP